MGTRAPKMMFIYRDVSGGDCNVADFVSRSNDATFSFTLRDELRSLRIGVAGASTQFQVVALHLVQLLRADRIVVLHANRVDHHIAPRLPALGTIRRQQQAHIQCHRAQRRGRAGIHKKMCSASRSIHVNVLNLGL